MRYYNKIYQMDQLHFMEQVKKESDNCDSYIKRMYEEIESIKKYQQKLYNKAQEILNQEYDYCIYFQRLERDKVIFEIRYIKYVKGTAPSNYTYTSNCMEFYKFTGKERKEAINLANKLSIEYKCKLIKNF